MVGGLGGLVRLALLASDGLFGLAYKIHDGIDIDGSWLMMMMKVDAKWM